MSSCAAPAGSPCRTGRGRVAAQYHTARFRLVPHLAKALSVPVPVLRKPGSAWAELPRPAVPGAAAAGHVRIGYARASTVRQLLDTQVDSLRASGVTRIFSEKISTRAVARPELDKTVVLAREICASGVAVTLVVHEHKRLGRGLELAALAEQLRAAGIGLEFLAGELQGSHDPSGIVFTVLAALSGMEREPAGELGRESSQHLRLETRKYTALVTIKRGTDIPPEGHAPGPLPLMRRSKVHPLRPAGVCAQGRATAAASANRSRSRATSSGPSP